MTLLVQLVIEIPSKTFSRTFSLHPLWKQTFSTHDFSKRDVIHLIATLTQNFTTLGKHSMLQVINFSLIIFLISSYQIAVIYGKGSFKL